MIFGLPRNVGSLARLVLFGIAGATAVSAASRRESGLPPHRCAAEIEAIEIRWNAVGPWRLLSPYPVRRYASPTESIGVWLERWSADEVTELRRVSVHETLVATFNEDECRPKTYIIRRRYDPAVMRASFSDEMLRSVVRSNSAGIIYVWSPGMPLSVDGLKEARAAAEAMDIAFTAVVADADGVPLNGSRLKADGTRPMESLELVYRGGTLHYPAVVLYRGGTMLDGVIPGFKTRDTYKALVTARFALDASAPSLTPHPSSLDNPRLWVDHDARVTTLSSVAMIRPVGYFFKPVAGSSLITYTSNNRAYLFNLETQREARIPGHIDPIPTPDGRFLTRPGFLVHSMPAIVSGDTAPIFVDPELPDEYQTASVLREGKDRLRYRVVTGWRDNARFRDYDAVLDTQSSTATFAPVGEPFVPCGGRVLALPISAKSGTEFGAFDVLRQTNSILEVLPDGTCVDRFDLGFASGKFSFSYDGKWIAFSTSRVNVDQGGTLTKPSEIFYKDALLLQRASGRIVSLTRNRPLRRMSFPEFLPDGTVMLLDQHVRGQKYGVIRVIEQR